MDILNRKLYEWEKKISSLYPITFIESGAVPKDAFSVQYFKNGLQLRYSHLSSALFAAKKIFEFLCLETLFPKGEHRAKSPWRVIYPECSIDESFLLQMLEEGFNAIILEQGQEPIAVLAKEMGIQVILKVAFPKDYCKVLPFDENYPETLKNFISSLQCTYDALYWQSPYPDHPCKPYLLEKFKLKHELYLEEIKWLENHGTVFYPFAGKQLEQHAGPNVYIAFPFIEGMNDKVPLIYCENNRRTFQKLGSGAIIQADQPWEEGSYYACHMEAAGAALWGLSSFEESGVNWFKLHRNEIKVEEERHLLTTLARFSSQYQNFRRETIEGFNAEKKLLQQHLQTEGRFYREMESYLEELTTLSKTV